MNVNVQRLEEIIAEYYPEDCTELLKASSSLWKERFEISPDAYAQYAGRPVVRVVDHGETDMSLQITYASGQLLSLNFKGVEKCCAMCFVYNFSVDPKINPEMLKKLMDEFLKGRSRKERYVWFTSRRLIVNMVEHRNYDHINPLADVEPSETPKVDYQPLFDYFHANARVRTMLMPNRNNGNIIHHMEVVFPQDYFDKV